ncbi:PucR family transcriptional regulator [Thermohalobacter berrensis]|uniref:PucR C-terminal helix-turn-helix domain-containing protein n=1 Tax=Thermohalobacter berrensis TaxID=99594 RepID=A0A419T5M8_9FIRM|nr:helix-turn-helix domain-containing protein [Thermohalobacter berrensis]RKD32736.1 hypothetical protein BET03_10400 [Thermohalobacter berrensis]
MSKNYKLEDLSDRLSKIIGFDLNITNGTNVSDNTTHISINGEKYIITTDPSNTLTEREKNIIKFFIQEITSKEDNYYSDISEKKIRRLLFDDIKEDKIKEIFGNFGFLEDKDIVVILLKSYEDNDIREIDSLVKNIDSQRAITVKIDEDLICIIYQKNGEETLSFPKLIVDAIETELLKRIKIGVSQPHSIEKIKTAYEEGKQALDIGVKFQLPGNMFFYEDLFIFRLVLSLSDNEIKRIYRQAIDLGIDKLSGEELKTANTFIDCNLNISQAARKLYVHRNTLIYRLDKIKKDIGFDLRVFNDVFQFKLLSIIYLYMSNKLEN